MGGPANLRLAELIGTLSLATDLGLGLEQEHMLRQCRIAMLLGEEIDAPAEVRGSAYYIGLLAWVGCTADSHELATGFGDDISLRRDTYETELAGTKALAYMLKKAGSDRSLLGRTGRRITVLATRGSEMRDALASHCAIASTLAQRLGLGPDVSEPLRDVFERWDGRGQPSGLKRDAIPLAVRLVQIADIAEVHHHQGGLELARAVIRDRSGGQFDPELAAAFDRSAERIFGQLDDELTWEQVLDSEPTPWQFLSGSELDAGLEAFADFVDLKSPWFIGHSRRFSQMVEAAGRQAGLPDDEVLDLRRAALLHDIGRIGVPNSTWDRPGELSPAERERVRLSPYLTERVLAHSEGLSGLARLASCHQERVDGSGYPRGRDGSSLSPAERLFAAADSYTAMRESRPYREALTPEQASEQLRKEVAAGRLSGDAVEHVLEAAGHQPLSARNRPRVAGLTAREMEVLLLIARGATSRDVSEQLVISEKTARNHTERIYSKLEINSRAELALFAMRQGLVT